ncbi:ataxin-7-like protein 1 isoform X2 [Diorhabda carinulata]|uniref:ataxin-7-like protein 1 isoform X2 n=1 Tax=Diorhabda carinulata TaxID=1163345 RepID=UPI0025A12154|nr:ataxin-7-like protein 1 isoform X2 [Diorhabda carinulata]
MEELFETFSEDITKWKDIKDIIDLDLDCGMRNDYKNKASVPLLPRRDVLLYGTIPKMEQRVYTKCKECRLVFNPRHILSHKSCPAKSHSTSHSLKKKVKSKGNGTKKSYSNLPPPPLFKKSPSPSLTTVTLNIPEISVPKVSSPKTSKVSTISSTSSAVMTISSSSNKSDTRIPSNTSSLKSHSPKSPSKSSISSSEHSPKSKSQTGENNSSSSNSSSSSNRHKKSRKSNSNTKITKEFDPDVHCGVVEGTKGPCTRSITCSNHRIQLRKLVAGRSKDIHQLIAERKTVKEKDLKHGSNCSYTSPNGQSEEKDSFSQNTTYVPALAAIANGSEPPDTSILKSALPKISEAMTPTAPRQTTSLVAVKQDTENGNEKTKNNNYIMNKMHSQECDIGTVPVVYMPLSLISFMQLGKKVRCKESPQSAKTSCVTSNSLFLTIPNPPHMNTKSYKSHPKPVAVPNYGSKKVGGAILLYNQHIEYQRNDILMAINTKRKTINNTQGYRAISLLNHSNPPHRPNILKVKKLNCKRTAVDKINTCDSKQMRLTKLMGTYCSPI